MGSAIIFTYIRTDMIQAEKSQGTCNVNFKGFVQGYQNKTRKFQIHNNGQKELLEC